MSVDPGAGDRIAATEPIADLPPIAVLVVAYGAPELLERALDALGGELPVLVVDNSGSPDCHAAAERHGATYLDPGANLGFAAAVNLGVARLPGDGADVLLLNPDASIDPDGVRALHKTLHATPGVACATPRLRSGEDFDRELWPIPTPGGVWRDSLALKWRDHRPQFAAGAVLLLNRRALSEIGPFDERFFLYAEETDWQLRAQRAGWRSVSVPDVVAQHVGAATSTDERTRMVRFHGSAERFFRKWYGPGGWAVVRAGALVGAAARASLDRSPERRRSERDRFSLYVQGPLRSAAPLSARARPYLRVALAVRSAHWAGVERYVATLAPLLAEREMEVTVIGGDPTAMAQLLPPSVTFRPAPTTGAVARVLISEGPFDVVHVHMSAAEAAAVVARPWTGGTLIATRHFSAARGSTPPRRLALSVLVGRQVAREVAISEFVASEIGVPSTVVHSAVPDQPAGRHDRRVVLVAQRLDPEKDTTTALEAFAVSGLGEEGWELWLAGSGEEEDVLRSRAGALGIEKGCRFLGHRRDLPDLYAQAAVLLATTSAEGFGLAVVEAMATGLPVVATASGAHLETVGTCTDAALFPPRDGAAAGAALGALARDPDRRARYGKALRRHQQERFSLARLGDEMAALYRSVVAERGPLRADPPPPAQSGP